VPRQRLPLNVMEAAAENRQQNWLLAVLFNTDACGRTFTTSEKGAPGVSGPSACGMNDVYRRVIPMFWAVFIMRP
jgi:hypothetical protein